MKNGLFIALVACLFFSSAHSEEFFNDCDDIANESSYRLLNEYISSISEDNDESPMQCQRLNDQEFLYTTFRNFYYCISTNGAPLKCAASENNTWFPSLSVVKRFTGGNGKKFVLFKVSQLSHGNFGEGYHAFFLVPKRIAPRGYTVFFFREAGAQDSNDGEGMCYGINDDVVVKAMTPPFEIINESQSNVTVRFNQERTNCKAGDKFRQTLEYTWQNGNFQITKNQLDKLTANP